jgi:hypothetical protein
MRKKEQDGFCEEKPPRNERLMLRWVIAAELMAD